MHPRRTILLVGVALAWVLLATTGCSPTTTPPTPSTSADHVTTPLELDAQEPSFSTPDAEEPPAPEAEPQPTPEPEPPATPPDAAALLEASRAVEARIAAGEADAKIAYLTFDDGPSDNTPSILAVLREHQACGTFFVKGNSDRIDYVQDITSAGNAVGLHTFTHDYAQLYASDDAYYTDLTAVQDAVSSRIGHQVNIIRFPGGTSNTVSGNYNVGIMSRLSQSVGANGYAYFDWNVSSGDASNPALPTDAIINNVLSTTNGMQRICVLMHDTNAKGTTVEALPSVIEGLREQGYTFGLLEHDTPAFHHGVNN